MPAAKDDPQKAADKAEKDLAEAQKSGVGIRDAMQAAGDLRVAAAADAEAKARAKADKAVYTGE